MMSEQPKNPNFEASYYRGKCPQGGEYVFSTEKLRFGVDENGSRPQLIMCPNHPRSKKTNGVAVPVEAITDEEWRARAEPKPIAPPVPVKEDPVDRRLNKP